MELAGLLSDYKLDFELKYENLILPSQRQAMNSILGCRKPECGEMLVQCTHCGKLELKPHSCGHRSCPKCQNHEATEWLERQRQKLLPVPYFLVTFTVPAQLRNTIGNHQRVAFESMFRAGKESLEEIAENNRYMGGEIGMTGVLHTHSRKLEFHPHIHFLVPAGCINRKQKAWKRKRWKFLFPENALADLFRGKLLALFGENGLMISEQISASRWVVNCKRVGRGEKALEYLSRYLYRGVISEKRIVENKDGKVTFLYRENKSGKLKRRTLPGPDFLRLLLQHVLPKGFRRARDYGFLHGNAKKTLRLVQLLLHVRISETGKPKRPAFICSVCGKEMRMVVPKIYRLAQNRELQACSSP